MFLIRTGAIEGFEPYVTQLGGNPIVLMRKCGLSPSQLQNPNSYVSYSQVADLLELAADSCGEPLFGLRLSRHQTSSVLGDLSLTLSRQPTLGDALQSVNQYLYLHARGVRLNRMPRGDRLQLELVIDISSTRGLFQLVQLSVGQLANFVTELLDLQDPKFPLFFRQVSPGPSILDEEYRSRIKFEAPFDGIEIPGSWLARAPNNDESALRQHFDQHLRVLQQRYPDNLQDQVCHIIGQILPSGECSIDRVAASLGLHPRVLQKRLNREGSTYAQLLRQTRLDIAEQHLSFKSMSITDLALNLGYAEVSIFSRNFKDWTGLSPRDWQQRRINKK